MTGLRECPDNWEYSDHPRKSELYGRAQRLLLQFRCLQPDQQLEIAKDTRRYHNSYFEGFTPESFEYFAGHYRGEDFRCLDTYRVVIRQDPRVGHPPALVPRNMERLSQDIERAIAKLDLRVPEGGNLLADVNTFLGYARVATAIFVYFLEIHPYANGNGHMARAILLLLFARHEVYPKGWKIDPRPADPPYSNLISMYRNGDRDPLVNFIISHI